MGTLVGRISYLLKRIRPAAEKTRGASAARPRPAPSHKRSLRFISCMASSVSDSWLLFICTHGVRGAECFRYVSLLHPRADREYCAVYGGLSGFSGSRPGAMRCSAWHTCWLEQGLSF